MKPIRIVVIASSVCPLMKEEGKMIVQACWQEGLAVGKTGSCSGGQGHVQWIFNSVFCWWVELCSLPVSCLAEVPSTGVDRLYGRAKGNLQKDLCQHAPFWTVTARVPVPAAGQVWPTPLQETLKHSQAGLAQFPVESLFLSPGSWWTQGFVCAFRESLFPPVLWKFCNQIPLYIKVRFPGDSQSLCQTPRLGSLKFGA